MGYRWRGAFSAGLLGLICAFGSLPASAQGASAVVIGSEGVIPPLDPQRTTGTVGLRVIDAIFDPLIREDLSQETDKAPPLKPALAEAWDVSDDGLVYTFSLRRGVTFHDG